MTKLPTEATFPAVHGAWQARLGNPDEGLQRLIAAGKLDAANRTVAYMYALVQCRRGTYAGAETKLRECLKADPTQLRAKRLLSLLKSATDDAKVRQPDYALLLAKEVFDQAETAAAHFALASASAESAKPDDALKHAKEAVSKASPAQVAWYRETLKQIEAKQPVRIDWKTFDAWASL
jgi:predicted Zn-dependent protease